MRVLDIKGLVIGTGRPKTIVSLMDPAREGLLASAGRAVSAGAECLEWRADFFAGACDEADVAALSRELAAALPRTPLVFTYRSRAQGGQGDLAPAAYRSLCEAVIAAGAVDLVDVELGIGDEAVRELVAQAHAQGLWAIVSHHDFGGTPDLPWMADCLAHMADLGADIPKLAVMAHTDDDAARLMEATSQAARRLDVPLLTMAMGERGAVTRLCGERFGSALTFCALGRASAPGQVELAEAIAAMEELHRQLA